MTSGDVTAGRVRREPVVTAHQAASKVPQITVFFWIIKILTTAQGEATSDWLVYKIDPFIAVAIGFVALVVALALQFRARRYVAWVYWLTVDMVAIFGTMAADGMHIQLGIPYAVSSAFFAVVLAVVLVCWYVTERTLSIHSIRTRRREAFYWATVLSTFALGTALGDMTATTLHLGYLTSGIMFTLIFAVPGVAHRWLRLNVIAAFWFAYIVTRPLGASYADWMGVPRSVGGLGFGRGPVAIGLTIPIIAFVAYLAISRRDVEEPAATPLAPRAPRSAGPGRHRS
ncbi:MAG TPA: hypothetical protein VMC03_02510 [Streptosporangiaceae bacterium]|nr:hypothetical protein [Streptosporangiaceae bacterium]